MEAILQNFKIKLMNAPEEPQPRTTITEPVTSQPIEAATDEQSGQLVIGRCPHCKIPCSSCLRIANEQARGGGGATRPGTSRGRGLRRASSVRGSYRGNYPGPSDRGTTHRGQTSRGWPRSTGYGRGRGIWESPWMSPFHLVQLFLTAFFRRSMRERGGRTNTCECALTDPYKNTKSLIFTKKNNRYPMLHLMCA